MLTWLDVAIPGLIGLWWALGPKSSFKPSGDPESDAAKERTMRRCGIALLVVTAGYFVIKLARVLAI
jgi:hypothetical protein